MVDQSSYFSFQPVLHDWYSKGRGMCYPVILLLDAYEVTVMETSQVRITI